VSIEINYEVSDPVAVDSSADFMSYLSDIERARLTNDTELKARLNVKGGYARDPNGYTYQKNGASVPEKRQVTEEQRELIEKEAQAFNSIYTNVQFAESYGRFYYQIITKWF
jgi:hypothetical protein